MGKNGREAGSIERGRTRLVGLTSALLASAVVAAALAVVAAALAASPASVQSTVWDEDGPWGPYGWDKENRKFHQPGLGTPIPERDPLGAYDDGDFDSDGVANIDDNCLLVPNPGQRPAVKPRTRADRRAYRNSFGPRDMLRLAGQWKRQHPTAHFRTDRELGEACSGYSDNYLRTTKALIDSSDRRKLEIFRFLGVSGPMFGGAVNPFPNGKPTDYDRFGTVSEEPDLEPNPTKGDDLAQNADGSLAKGNMTPSMPICSGYGQFAAFVRWLSGTEGVAPLDELQEQGREMYEGDFEDQFGCHSDLQRPAWEQAMRHGWAGKRLYTNAKGGRITNRFVASVTEHPLYNVGLKMEPFNTLAEQTGGHPYADEPTTSGQSRHGIIFRGRSYLDGHDAILMDWRGFEAAWPLGQGEHIDGMGGNLIYDECRAIQTGVYNCTAVVDMVMGERRHTFQEGYMPWVVKGPPSIEEYIEAIR